MRKPIDIKHCIQVGYIKKTHGVQGGLHLILEEGMEEAIENLDFLFFEIDGLPVPFFIDEITSLGFNFANVNFKNIENKDKAQPFVGCKLLIDRSEMIEGSDTVSPNLLKGFTIIDETLGELGKVEAVDDFGGNLVLTIKYANREVMIPFNEELIVSFNMEKTCIIMDLPEGLIDLSE